MGITNVVQGAQTVEQSFIKDKSIEETNKHVDNSESVNLNHDHVDKIKEEDLQKSLRKLNKFIEDQDIVAEYSHHEKLDAIMIKIVNIKTKEVIKEIPPKKILDMVADMCERVGILVDKKA